MITAKKFDVTYFFNFQFGEAAIFFKHIMTDNGVIHVVDKVLMPPMKMA